MLGADAPASEPATIAEFALGFENGYHAPSCTRS